MMNNKALVKGSLSDTANGRTLAESFLNADAILIVDMSGSMAANDAPGGLERWDAAENELRRLQEENPGKLAVMGKAMVETGLEESLFQRGYQKKPAHSTCSQRSAP